MTTLRQQTTRLEALLAASRDLTAQLSLDKRYHALLSHAIDITGGEAGYLYVHRRMHDLLEPVVTIGVRSSANNRLNRRATRIAEEVLQSRSPRILQDVQDGGECSALTTIAALPVHQGDQMLGVLEVVTRSPDAFSPGDIDLLSRLTHHGAVAIRNARCYEETTLRAEHLAIVNRIAHALGRTLDLEDLTEVVYREVEAAFELDAFFIALYDEERGELDYRFQVDGGTIAPPERKPVGTGLTATVIKEKEPLLIRDFEEEREHLPSAELWGTMRTPASWLGVPMQVTDRTVGVICVQAYRSHAYGEVEKQLLSTIAEQVAVGVENARLFQAERKQRQQTKALEEAAAIVSGTLHLDQVLDRILEQVEKVVTGDAFNVLLIEEDDHARVVRRRGYDREDLGVRSLSLTDYPLLLEMIETGSVVVVPNTATEPRWVLEKGQELWQSYVGAPIKVGGAVVGFLNVNGTRTGTFGRQDAQRLQAFANHAATAIENAQLYQELHNYADGLEERVEERTSQLRAQYAQLEAILDNTTDGIILAGSDGELVLANPVARNWLRHALSPEESGQLRKAVKALAARAEEKPELMLELTGMDLQLTAAPVQKPTMDDARAVVAIHDISHLKTLNRMKSRFVSNVSHELRTPIATIKLLAHLMRQQPERWDEYLEPLLREAEHQANLVRDILEMSRVDAGRLEIHTEPIGVNNLVEMAIEKYQNQAQDQGLTLTRQLGEPGPIALADPQWMMQVLNNLLSNAIRYTPEGGTITVATGKEAANARWWATITVADTGIGIPEDELPYIFDRFFRGDKPRMMQISGTGLGLAILKEIVELHGGRVTVESEVDEGSCFTVWLPHNPT